MARPDEAWMPMYWGDYLKKTARFTLAHHGAYMLLIAEYWSTGAPIPADAEEQALIVRLPVADWMELRPKIAEKFDETPDGKWHHERIDKELVRAAEKSAAKSRAGARGAAKRWQTDSRRIADASVCHKQNDAHSQSQSLTPPSEGADAPLKERIFGPALEWLAKQSGKPKDKLRPLVGRWCSKHGDGATLEALAAAAKNAPLDPIPYIERVLKPKAPNGKPDAQASASAHLEGLASIFGTQPMAADRPKSVEQGRVIDGDFRAVGSPEAGDGPGIHPGNGGTDRVRGSVRDSMPRAEGGPKNLPRGPKAPAGRPHSSGRGAHQGDVGVGQSDADASGSSESGEGRPCGEGDAARAGEGGEVEGPGNIGVKERDCPGEVGSLAASASANDEQPDFDPVANMPDWMRRTA